MLEALTELAALAPEFAQPFADTEYPLPLQLALYGRATPTAWLIARAERAETPAGALEPALALAEAVESVAPDRHRYFQTDAKTRSHVFMGAKWRAGWALLLGDGVDETLVREVVAREFLTFCVEPPADLAARTVAIPARPTGVVYFLQVAVRYGMIYGRIAPGDSHELGHFLEADVPGVVVARGNLSPLESYLILGLMKLGVPAVVPPDFPYPQGRQATAERLDDALVEMARFPNLRVKEFDGRPVRLPDYADPANAREGFAPARVFGGANSFLVCQRDPAAQDRESVVGEAPASGGDVGITVGVALERVNELADDATLSLFEERARTALGLLRGVRTQREDPHADPLGHVFPHAHTHPPSESFGIEVAPDTAVDPRQWAEVVRRSLQFQYPRLGAVDVRVSFDADDLTARAGAVRRERAARRARLADLAGVEPDVFYACTDCQPFSKEHVCFVAASRPPMCGRDWRDIAAGSLFGVGYFPYKRRADAERPNEAPIAVGECLDRERGEFAGVNAAVAELSHGAISRVNLYSVRDFPHTSCGCFHFLAFWIAEAGGLGVMHRNFAGRAPNGETWDTLANKAGGKQSPGVTGVGPDYLPLAPFLRGDGGLANVVWMTRKAREAAGPGAAGIPTEADATTIEQLVELVAARRERE